MIDDLNKAKRRENPNVTFAGRIIGLIMFLLFSFLFFVPIQIFAKFTQSDFEHDLQLANRLRGKVIGSRIEPKKIFRDFQSNPSQTKYFSGVAQGDDNGLSRDANAASLKDPSGQVIVESFKTRPKFKLNPKSQMIKRGDLIKNDAKDIMLGISDKYVDCHAHKNCHRTYVEKTCEESTQSIEEICTKTPDIKIQADKDKTFTGQIKQAQNLQSGAIEAQAEGTIKSFKMDIKISKGLFCRALPYKAYLNNTLLFSGKTICHGFFSGFNEVSFKVDDLNIPIHSSEPLKFRLVLQYGHKEVWQSAVYTMDVLEKEPKITWKEVCKDV